MPDAAEPLDTAIRRMMREMRASTNSSLREFADGLGVTATSVMRWESGSQPVRVDLVDRWAERCGFQGHVYFLQRGTSPGPADTIRALLSEAGPREYGRWVRIASLVARGLRIEEDVAGDAVRRSEAGDARLPASREVRAQLTAEIDRLGQLRDQLVARRAELEAADRLAARGPTYDPEDDKDPR